MGPGHRWLVSRDTGSHSIRSERTLKVKQAVAGSRVYLGVPYVWGGASRQGVDCFRPRHARLAKRRE